MNGRPPAPKAGALTRLRHAPKTLSINIRHRRSQLDFRETPALPGDSRRTESTKREWSIPAASIRIKSAQISAARFIERCSDQIVRRAHNVCPSKRCTHSRECVVSSCLLRQNHPDSRDANLRTILPNLKASLALCENSYKSKACTRKLSRPRLARSQFTNRHVAGRMENMGLPAGTRFAPA